MGFLGVKKKSDKDGDRVIGPHTAEAATDFYASNYVSTTKYNPLTFLPRNLFEQFRRVANLYFLIMAILASIKVISPINPVTSWMPLCIVLGISAFREALEDYKRYRSDVEINGRLVLVLRPDSSGKKSFIPLKWADIRVGDIVKCLSNEFFPSDMILISSSDTQSSGCYVETANLDGETNLKNRSSLKSTRQITEETIASFKCEATCEPPSNDIFKFRAKLEIGGQMEATSLENLLMRGCKLKNTKWTLGMVVYTGHESKVMMNMTEAPSKVSNIERRLNVQIGSIFGLLFLCCFIGAVGAGVVVQRIDGEWYLQPSTSTVTFNVDNPALSGTVSFFTFVILYSQMIPISLYVTMEMVKSFLAILIGWDAAMYSEAIDQCAEARTSNLLEELGQVQYIFSDKTGTLTQNVMEFRKCTIGGVNYGEGSTEVERSIAKRQGKILPPDPKPPPGLDPDFKFVDKRLLFEAWREQPTAEIISEFILLLGVCHGVQVEDKEDGSMEYQAASPDEGALVKAAKNLGCAFTGRVPGSLNVVFGKESQTYQLLCVNEFNSDRKRQSVVLRRPDGRLVLFCKGADTTIYKRLRQNDPLAKITAEHMEAYADQGLRTLCLSKRDLSEGEFAEWNKVYTDAATSMTNREEMLDAAAELIEKDLELLGATAIEDKLQENVADCIATLANADIKLWVLTGDKEETAINIGFACSVLEQGMDIMICRAKDIDTTVDAAQIAAQERTAAQEVLTTLQGYVSRTNADKNRPYGLVITGGALSYALQDSIKMVLLDLGTRCKAVICCRVSPDQKASVTRLVKDNMHKITLAIGDGANDVSMIQAAHIGVGIRGLEGMQAALASDYTISQFRFLEKLIMVHGIWSYRRIATLVCYFFYKNVTFAMSMFWFSGLAAFSGQSLYDDMYQALYNIFFTSLPVMSYGGFERDASEKMIKKFPLLYRVGQNNLLFNWSRFLSFAFGAVAHSSLIFWITAYTDDCIQFKNGMTFGMWEMGTNACDNLIWVVTLVISLEIRSFTIINITWIALSIFVWYCFLWSYHSLPPGAIGKFDTRDNIYNVIFTEWTTAVFWLNKLLVISICILPIFAYKFIKQLLFPEPVDFARYHYRERMPKGGAKPIWGLRNAEEGVSPPQSPQSPPPYTQGHSSTAIPAPAPASAPRAVPVISQQPQAAGPRPSDHQNDVHLAGGVAPKAAPAPAPAAPSVLEPQQAQLGYLSGQQSYEHALALLEGRPPPRLSEIEMQPLRPVGEIVSPPMSPVRTANVQKTSAHTQFHVGNVEEIDHLRGFDYTPAPHMSMGQPHPREEQC